MKKLILLLLISALGLFFFAGCEGLVPSEGEGESEANVYVSTVGDDNNDGSMGHPWRTIQYALNNTLDGEIIQVAAGVYNENTSFPSDRALVLKSKSGASSTIIDGGNIESVVEMESCPDGTVLDDFTITGGDSCGIRIFNCSPTIKNNTISKNQGGGILIIANCSPIIKNNTISENTSTSGYLSSGGGISIFSCSPTIQDNIISKNIASWSGGGIYVYCSGIYSYISSPEILNNTISENTAKYGGGIDIIGCLSANIHIQGNIISKNIASSDGGGIIVGEFCSPIIGGTSAGDTLNFNTVCGNSPNQIYPNSYPNNYILTDCN